MSDFPSAEIDKKAEAIYFLGSILNRFADVNVVSIKSDIVDKNMAAITLIDPHRNNYEYERRIDIGGDSVIGAFRKIIDYVGG